MSMDIIENAAGFRKGQFVRVTGVPEGMKRFLDRIARIELIYTDNANRARVLLSCPGETELCESFMDEIVGVSN